MKLAIFHAEDIPTLHLLKNAARKVGFNPQVFHFRDMRLFLDGNNFDIKVGNQSIKKFSLIFVRGFWNYQDEVSLLAKFCKRMKIPLLDTGIQNEHTISKNDDLLILQEKGLPIIKTIFLENKQDANTLLKELKFPIVAKECKGKRGFDVHLLINKKQLTEFLTLMIPEEKTSDTKTYQFQEFIPADFDVRVLVLGKKVLGAIERRSADPHDFRHNISLGGHAKSFDSSNEMNNMAIRAAQALKYEFAGVDFIQNKQTGKWYLLEINRSPGFEGFMKATGINVPLEVMKFFLQIARKHIQ